MSLAAPYLAAYGLQTKGSLERQAAADANLLQIGAASLPLQWDVWLLAVKARLALNQQEIVVSELKQAINCLNCSLDVASAAVKALTALSSVHKVG